MGYVYYGNYATYYEVARVESLRSLGLSYKKLEDQGIMLPVLENYSKFVAPAKYDDLLSVKLMVKKMPEVRMVFNYEIINEEEKLINLGETKLVFVNMKTGKPCEMPEDVKALFLPFF